MTIVPVRHCNARGTLPALAYLLVVQPEAYKQLATPRMMVLVPGIVPVVGVAGNVWVYQV